jgi:hypothetical protein
MAAGAIKEFDSVRLRPAFVDRSDGQAQPLLVSPCSGSHRQSTCREQGLQRGACFGLEAEDILEQGPALQGQHQDQRLEQQREAVEPASEVRIDVRNPPIKPTTAP